MNLWCGESDEQLEAALAAAYPTLRLVRGVEGRTIRGAFNVEHGGVFVAGFEIELLLDHPDALGLPTVRETGGRIPRVPERHVNRHDGAACLYLPEDLALRRLQPYGIADFLGGPVFSYYLGQAGVELGRPFPFGEWKHGADGLREMLATLLDGSHASTFPLFLETIGADAPKGHWACPCGSGRPLRGCHLELIQRLRSEIPRVTRLFLLRRGRELLGDSRPRRGKTRQRPRRGV